MPSALPVMKWWLPPRARRISLSKPATHPTCRASVKPLCPLRPAPAPSSLPRLARVPECLGLTIDCIHAHHVLASYTGNGAVHHGFNAFSLADLARHIGREPLIGRASHIAQGVADTLPRKDIQEWRLLQLHRQGLFQRAIKNRIPCRVHEIGEQDGIFFRQLALSVQIKERPRSHT